MRGWIPLTALAVLVAWVGWYGSRPDAALAPAAQRPSTPWAAESSVPAATPLTLEVVADYGHDPRAFTQGLEWHDGALYESLGQYGESTLRRWDPATGRILDEVPLPAYLFGEGLTRVEDRWIQLSWLEGTALVWTGPPFRLLDEMLFSGEGWGLAFDGRRLIMSDGGSALTFRDPDRFRVSGSVLVHHEGIPAQGLNELEWADGALYANVLGEDYILRIDPESGAVTGVVDATGLLPPAERSTANVLNGIAYRAETGTFFLTGKYWPRIFEVRITEPSAPPAE